MFYSIGLTRTREFYMYHLQTPCTLSNKTSRGARTVCVIIIRFQARARAQSLILLHYLIIIFRKRVRLLLYLLAPLLDEAWNRTFCFEDFALIIWP